MKRLITNFLPNEKSMWKDFSKLAFFSLISTLMFSINGFIDNFMVGHIYHAGMVVDGVNLTEDLAKQMNEASIGGLGAAAAWWFIVNSVGTFFLSSVGFFLSQYFNKGDYRMTQRSTTTKMQIAFMWALPFILLMVIIPEQMMSVFTHQGLYHSGHLVNTDTINSMSAAQFADTKHVASFTLNADGTYSNVRTETLDGSYMNHLGGEYVRVAAVSWFVWIFVVPQNGSLREVGKPQGGALAVLGALVTHVSLNFAFIYGTDLGVVGPAIALIISRIVNFSVSSLYVWKQKLPTSVWGNPFIWDKEIYTKWIKRWSYLVYGLVWTIAIAMRTLLWSQYFDKDAIVVLGIAGAVSNIFLVAFDSLQPLLSKYVSGNMGRDKMKEAKEYSQRILGFGVLLSIIISVILLGIAFAVPHMTAVWDVNAETLKQVKECILVVSLVYWSWTILNTVRTVMSSGGRPGLMSIIDGTYTVLQSVWIVCIGLLHQHMGAFHDYGMAYLVFFLSDVVKLPFFLVPYFKVEWTKNHTKQEEKIVKVKRA